MPAIKKAILILSAALILTGCAQDKEEETAEYTETATETVTEIVTEAPAETPVQRYGKLDCLYYNEEEFSAFDRLSQTYETEGEVNCITVPHHLLAGTMIYSAFNTAKQTRESTETVVIVAPIHEPKGNDIITTLCGWNTPFGVLENDTELSRAFADRLDAAYDDDMIKYDHSASGLIPFSAAIFPEAKISCVLVSGQADKEVPERLAELLCEMSEKKNCLFVFSTDFSHYLEPHDTERMDEETRKAVLSGDTERIAAMNNDNTDSPPTVGTFVRLTKLLDCKTEELDHGNSLTYSMTPYSRKSYPEGITSYFVFGGIK